MKLLWVLALGHGATHWHRGAMSVSMPLILKALSMNYTQMGVIRSVQQFVAMLSTVMGGLATDVFDRRKAILVFAVLWPALFFFFQGYADTFVVFAGLVWLQMLFGGFLWHAPARTVIGENFPNRMGFGLGVHGMGASMAEALSPLVVGGLLLYMSWRAVFKLQIIPGFLVAMLLMLLLPPLGAAAKKSAGKKSYLAGFRSEILGNVPLLGVSLVGALRSIGENVIPSFLPLYLSYEMGMSYVTIGFYLSSLAMVGTVATPLVGHLSDHWGRKQTVFLCLFSGAMLITAIPWVQSPLILFPMVSFGGVVLFSVGPVIQAAGFDYTARELWGSTQSFMDVARSILSILFPLVAGVVADVYGLAPTFYLFGAVNLVGAVVMLLVPTPVVRKGG